MKIVLPFDRDLIQVNNFSVEQTKRYLIECNHTEWSRMSLPPFSSMAFSLSAYYNPLPNAHGHGAVAEY